MYTSHPVFETISLGKKIYTVYLMRVGWPDIRWMDSVEQDLKTLGVQKRKRKMEDRNEWRHIVGAIKACNRR